MAHDHGGHAHNHTAGANSRMLAIALGLTTAFLIAELIGSFVFNSLALLSDAAHMLTDSAALAIAVFRDLLRDRHRVVVGLRVLRLRLRAAVIDNYRRTTSKRGRYRPQLKDQPTVTLPKIRRATKRQRHAYQALANAP